jgi:hypothetical protein
MADKKKNRMQLLLEVFFLEHDFSRMECHDHEGQCCGAGCHDQNESQYEHYARMMVDPKGAS